METIIYLVLLAPIKAKRSYTIDIEPIPQASIEQCEKNGAAIRDLYKGFDWMIRDMKFKCIEGVKG